ncbi:hypothetical protein LFM09_01840 [Lentzea alba]|uniref:MAB_1171c family putative transporter n=1 Tax=Lentzea alba TaxID=2714351 RepID=UPI0039BF417C
MSESWSFVPKIVLAVLWLVTLLRLLSWRKSGHHRVITLVFVCFALSETVVLERARFAVDAALGVPELWRLFADLFGLLGVVLPLEVALAGARRVVVRGARAVFLSLMACMTAFFFAMPRAQEGLLTWDVRDPAVLAYKLTHSACLAIAMCVMFAILFPQWRSVRPGALRTALLLLLSSSVTGLVFSAWNTWNVVAHTFGFRWSAHVPMYNTLTYLLLYLALVLAGLGGLVRVLHRWREYLVRYRTYHRLGRLWAELTGAVPSVVLERPPRVLFSSLELRLFRRVVEIRDAQIELVGRVSPTLREEARIALNGTNDELDACTLLMALRLTRDGAPTLAEPVELTWAADLGLDGELRSLLALDHAMRRPAVGEAAGRALRSADLLDAEERRAVSGNLRADRA